MRKFLVTLAALAATLLAAPAARAQFNAYDNQTVDPTALQRFGNSLGLDFDVNSPIRVTQLGAFDNGDPANLGFQNPDGVTVAIYDRNTQAPVVGPLTFSPGDPGTRDDANVFKPLASPVDLGAGQYTLVAFNSPNYNSGGADNATNTTDTGGGLISFVGGGRFGGTAGTFPTQIDGGPADRYDIGSFIFTEVPEPASLGLLGLGGLLMLRRRR